MSKSIGVFLLIVIVLITYRLFFLVPWGYVAGSFDMADIALVLIMIGLVINANKIASTNVLSEPLGIMFILYFLMVGMHVALASFNYHQSILNGIIAARYQLFYLMFFLCVSMLDSDQKIKKLFDYISYIAIFALVAGVINYLGIKILYHYKAEDWGGIRAGYERIFIPGMPLIAFSVLWQLAKWINDNNKYTGIKLATLLAGVVFHRGRGLTLGLGFISFIMMLFKKQYKAMFGLFLSGVIIIIAAEFTLKENIFLYPIKGVAEGVETDKGEGGRFDQLQHDIAKFNEHPWIGSGLIAVRVSDVKSSVKKRQLAEDVRLVDLGYSHWVKHYGLLGIIWLLIFYWFLVKISFQRLSLARKSLNAIDLFAPAYVGFVIITSMLHNHLMVERRMILLAIVAAVLVVRKRSKPDVVESVTDTDTNDKNTVCDKYIGVKLK